MPTDQPGEAQARGPIRSEPGSLLEQVAVAVFGIDEADRICYWGPGAQGLFGHAAPDILTHPAAGLFPAASVGAGASAGADAAVGPAPAPADAAGGLGPAARLAERARALGYWRVRLDVLHRDGSVFDCGFRVFPVTGAPGAPGGSVVIGLASRGDELDRVKTNLAFLDALFENCPIGLV
ncbi:hypothetical protein ACFV0Q_33615, partial [Streptomyces sp. NPDC059564]